MYHVILKQIHTTVNYVTLFSHCKQPHVVCVRLVYIAYAVWNETDTMVEIKLFSLKRIRHERKPKSGKLHFFHLLGCSGTHQQIAKTIYIHT
jgi:hypothetical protein